MNNNITQQKTTPDNTLQRQKASHLIAIAHDWVEVNSSTHTIDITTIKEYKKIKKAKRKALSLINNAPKIVDDDCADELMEFSIPFHYLPQEMLEFMFTVKWFDELNMKPNLSYGFYSTITYSGTGEYCWCRVDRWFIDVFAYYELVLMRKILELDFTGKVA